MLEMNGIFMGWLERYFGKWKGNDLRTKELKWDKKCKNEEICKKINGDPPLTQNGKLLLVDL